MIEDYMATYFRAQTRRDLPLQRAAALALAGIKDQPPYFTAMWRDRAGWADEPIHPLVRALQVSKEGAA